MSTVIQEQPADVVVLGLGVMSGSVAAELTLAGYKVVGIERGPYYQYADDFAPVKYDEWGILYMRKFDQPLPLATFSMRHNSTQLALPVRRYTPTEQIISAGYAVGGMAQHYAGAMGRAGPWTYEMFSETNSTYGPDFITNIEPNADFEDWPMTYNDYVPYYMQWEQSWGIAGTNENPFIPMSADFPLPPHPFTPIGTAMQTASEALGFHPVPAPSALCSKPYVNQYGVMINQCVYDGYCGSACNYVCETGAKANAAYRTIPAAIATGKFTMALNSYVFRINVDQTTGLATSVSYYDPMGNIHVQPGTVIFNGLWGFNLTRAMYLSDIGAPYNPTTVSGSLGRGLTEANVVGPSALGTINIGGNAYPAGNASGGGYIFHDLSDDNFDHTGLNFIGGMGMVEGIGTYAGGGPGNLSGYAASAAPTNIGSIYKATWKDIYLPTQQEVAFFSYTNQLPVTDYYTDIDPHYKDLYGDPLARITLDYGINEFNTANYVVPKMVPVLQKMGCTNIITTPAQPPGSVHVNSWQAHSRGGARVGTNSSTSVFNQWQQCWTCENLFAAGEITDMTGSNLTAGTHQAGPASYVAAEGIKMYLQNPGLLS